MKSESIKESVQELVQKLYDKRGHVSPSELLLAAKVCKTPAHDGFTWDDAEAGEQFRLIEARQWLRVVVVRTEADAPERLVHIPAMLEDGEQMREGYYKPSSVIVDVDEFERARDAALSRFVSARVAVEELQTISERSGKRKRTKAIGKILESTTGIEQAIAAVN